MKNEILKESQTLTINFVYFQRIIGEIEFRFCEKPANYYANRFINQLINSNSPYEFEQIILQYISKLVEHGKIYFHRQKEPTPEVTSSDDEVIIHKGEMNILDVSNQ